MVLRRCDVAPTKQSREGQQMLSKIITTLPVFHEELLANPELK